MKRFIIWVYVVALILTAAGCSNQSMPDDADSGTPTNNSSTTADDTSTSAPAQVVISDDDNDSSWEAALATMIVLSDTITVNGSGASVNNNIVTITTKGTYVITGSTSNGQIVVNATTKDEVQIVLNEANITNPTGAGIYAPQCDNLKITLADGTQNTVTDGGNAFIYADNTNEEPNAAIFSKDNLTINGTGSLTVNAGFNNGIGTKDNLVIISGSYVINAANHGLRGNDSVAILNGDFNITAGNDGIRTNNEKDAALGMIDIRDGVFKISTAHDGIQSTNGILITGGNFDIKTGSDASKSDTDSDSYKGIKATGSIDISSGTFIITSTDDSIHSNANISIKDGSFTLVSGDDGIHADDTLNVSGGNINVTKSYEALEGSNVIITGGTMNLVASDDGINAAGGSSNGTDGGPGQFGGDRFGGRSGSSAGGNYSIAISGGSVTFYAGGDGLDSNGTVDISGGTVVAIINSSADNSALDSDGVTTITGGTVIAGGTGTFESLGSGSTQSYIYLSGISAGTEIIVQKSGKTLVSYTADKTLSYLTIFAPGITNGESYDASVNGDSTSITAGIGGGRNMGGGMGDFGGGRQPRR